MSDTKDQEKSLQGLRAVWKTYPKFWKMTFVSIFLFVSFLFPFLFPFHFLPSALPSVSLFFVMQISTFFLSLFPPFLSFPTASLASKVCLLFFSCYMGSTVLSAFYTSPQNTL